VRGEYVTAKRGTKEPNTIGLYDMSGNVSEMTCDTIPEGDGIYVKGGACYSSKDALKIDAESQLLFGVKGIRCGFRLVREDR
jgi:formylglycine-generating enzyme required for sulfatase activity